MGTKGVQHEFCPFCRGRKIYTGREIPGIPAKSILGFESDREFNCDLFFLCFGCGLLWSHVELDAFPAPTREAVSEMAAEEAKRSGRPKVRFGLVVLWAVVLTPLLAAAFFKPVMLLPLVGVVGFPVLLQVASALVRRLRDRQPLPEQPFGFSFAAAAMEFKKWESLVSPALFAAGLGLTTYALGSLLRWMRLSWAEDGAAVFTLHPSGSVWFAYAFAFGLPLANLFMQAVLRMMLGARFPRYLYYVKIKNRADETVLVALMVIVLLPVVALLPLTWDTSTRFFDDRVEINRFWSFGATVRPYSEIRQLRHVSSFTAPNGNVVHRPHHAIVFRDGTVWRTKDGGRDENPREDKELFAFLKGKTGLPLTPFALDPDD